MNSLVIIGAGGLGKEALWVSRAMGIWDCRGFADDRNSGEVDGAPVLGRVDDVVTSDSPAWFHVAIGNNEIRKKVSERFLASGWKAATLIHPSVVVAPSVRIGEGTYVAPGSVLCPFATLGAGVLINCCVSVGHDAVLGDYVQACPGVRISGNCKVGELAFLGSNAVLQPGIKVGARASVAAASFALRNVPDGETVIGVPAKRLG